MDKRETRPGKLVSSFSPLGMWAFSIGTSIGWGSFIVTCNTYLQKAGVLGTVFGLILGMAVIFVITWNLQHMIVSSPNAGGIYAFQKRMGGKDLGFLAFWFVLLTYLAILWANITSLPLFARFFLGDLFRFGFHYHIFGYEVWLGEALLSMVAVVLISLLCVRSSRLPDKIMIGAATTFALGFTVCAVFALIGHEPTYSYSPLYIEGSGAFSQIIRIAVISPWAFIGFENVSHFSEEYTFPRRKIRGVLIGSVIATTVLYLFVSLLSVSAYPPEYASWFDYISDMGNLEGIKAVPAFYAADHYLGQSGVFVLMLALFGVILTSLIGNLLALSRLLYAAGRGGEAPPVLAKLNSRGIPDRAILAIAAITFFIPFLGRTAIGWIVDVTTLGATMIYWLISHAVYLDARNKHLKVEQATGIIGMALMLLFIFLLLIPNLLPFHAMATESYALFIVWAVLGLAYFRILLRRDRHSGHSQSVVVWILLLLLVLFASMMWVTRVTDEAANAAVDRIYEYHQSHPEHDEDDSVERSQFLREQAKQISGTNTLYTVFSLGLFMLFTGMIINNYRDNQRLGQELSAAEDAARAAKKIAELKESISSLLDNMPVMSFSKDAETGVYLACNQAFAEYAGKDSPAGVAGLTDYEIFDSLTSAHFVEDDRKALRMDKPYVFYEEVADANGWPRHFETTKLKFYDQSGRLCLLGMSLDVTEMERVKRAHEQTEAAYREALNTSTVYENIISSLSGDYFDLYYVDLETDEYIEYGSRTETGQLRAEHRGVDFFAQSRANAASFIYDEDREYFLDLMDKERILSRIRKSGTFIMQYRLLIAGVPTYVNMKATVTPGDERHMILGVNNVDAQVRDRITALNAKEEKKTYNRLSALNGNLIVLYFVDPQNDQYTEFSSTSGFKELGIAKQGNNFFISTYEHSLRVVHPEDQELFHSQVTKENILRTIENDGVFMIDYRLIIGDMPTYVRFKAAKIVEDGKPMLIIGLLDEDAQIRHEMEFEHDLVVAKNMANRDALTGVKNKYAYVDAENSLNSTIEDSGSPEFAIVVCDINNLKLINDTKGHKEGDKAIRRASAIICGVFKQSPVYRIGGDEFAVICQGHDYEHLDELMARMHEHNSENRRNGDSLIACGMARYEGDRNVEAVFERADKLMYKHKAALKM